MTAKVSNELNLMIAQSFYDQLKSTTGLDTFYAAVAFSESAEYLNYSGSLDSESEFFGGEKDSDFDVDDSVFYSQNTTTLHRILPGGISRVVPRVNWVQNRIYNSWPAPQDFYVLVKEFVSGVAKLNVYKCLFSPGQPSTVAPTGASGSIFETTDGYRWLYLYTISNSEAIRFLTDEWMPVPERVSDAEAETLISGSTRYLQYIVQENAILGTVFSLNIDSDTLYSYRDSEWRDENFKLEVRISDSRADSDLIPQRYEGEIRFDSETNKFKPTLFQNGVGYQGVLKVTEPDGTRIPGVTADIARSLGHGYSAADDLSANNVMLVVRNIPDGDFLKLATNKFQMVNLVRNPIDSTTQGIAKQDFYVGCKYFTAENETTFVENDIIQPFPSDDGRRGRVIAVDGRDVYYVNYREGREDDRFIDSEQVSLNDGVNKVTTVEKAVDRQVVFGSGDLIMADWKANPIERANDQIESINFIFQF